MRFSMFVPLSSVRMPSPPQPAQVQKRYSHLGLPVSKPVSETSSVSLPIPSEHQAPGG